MSYCYIKMSKKVKKIDTDLSKTQGLKTDMIQCKISIQKIFVCTIEFTNLILHFLADLCKQIPTSLLLARALMQTNNLIGVRGVTFCASMPSSLLNEVNI